MKKLIFLFALLTTSLVTSQVQPVSNLVREKIERQGEINEKFDLNIFQQLDGNDQWLRQQISQLNANYNAILFTLEEMQSQIDSLQVGGSGNVDSSILARLSDLEAKNQVMLDSLDSYKLQISSLQTQNNIQSEALWNLRYRADSDSIKIAIMNNRLDNVNNTVNTVLRDEIEVVCSNCSQSQQPVNLIDFDSISYANEGFSFVNNEILYDGSGGDYGYINFKLKQNLKVGEEAVFLFDLMPTSGTPTVSLWMYYDPDNPDSANVDSPKITGEENYSGEIVLPYTETGVARNKLGIRARNTANGGGSFVIKNLRLVKTNGN